MVLPSNGKSFTCVELEESIRRQMVRSDLNRLTGTSSLSHAVCGLTEEAGEVAGLLKREVYRMNAVSDERWVEELGDVFWYLIACVLERGLTLDEVFMHNQLKCTERYGEF